MDYRSKALYTPIIDSVENIDQLKDLGYVAPMGPTGLTVVYDNRNQMISAILSADDFISQYEPAI